MTPATQPSSRIANASRGVGSGRGSVYALKPAPVITSAVSRAKTSELWRASYPITTWASRRAPRSRRYAARPAAARCTTTRFIRFGPAPSAPRSPAVPNSSVPSNRSARSVGSPPAATSATIRSSSALVRSSGSCAAHSRARSSRSDTSEVVMGGTLAPARPAGGNDLSGRHHGWVSTLPPPRDPEAAVGVLVVELAGWLGVPATVGVCLDLLGGADRLGHLPELAYLTGLP